MLSPERNCAVYIKKICNYYMGVYLIVWKNKLLGNLQKTGNLREESLEFASRAVHCFCKKILDSES